MKQKVLLLSGKHSSGCTSAAHFITGLMLQQEKIVDRFEIDDNGKLVVNTVDTDDGNNLVTGEGVLDLESVDERVLSYLYHKVWPIVRIYYINDPINVLLQSLFNVDHKHFYGTKEEQDQVLDYKMSQFGAWIAPRHAKDYKSQEVWDKKVTASKLTEITKDHFRRIDEDIWSKKCFKSIAAYTNKLAVVDGIKYSDEVKFFKGIDSRKFDVKIIRFTRRVDFMSMPSEIALDGWRPSRFDGYIDNAKMTLKEKNFAIIDLLTEWGWV